MLLSVLLPSALARADIITCSFTEPFVTTVYSTNLNTLTVTYEVDKRSETLANISFQIMKPGMFELWDAKQDVVQRLTLSFQGSDGMSDRAYPYDAEWLAQKLRGGCTSNHLSYK